MQKTIGLNKLLRLVNEGWMIVQFGMDGHGEYAFVFHRLFATAEIVAKWELDVLKQQEYLEIFKQGEIDGVVVTIWRRDSGIVVIE